jgi:DNA-binding MarR family transcriptional regulator
VKKYLQRYCVYAMPMANKDGVARGRTRFNLNGKDLNRDWERPADAALAPENHALESWLRERIKAGEPAPRRSEVVSWLHWPRRANRLHPGEIKRIRTIQTPRMATGHEIAMALRGAYLAMHRRSEAAFARHGVTADQFVLLASLTDSDALTQRELAGRTGSDPNTVRAMLLLLEGRGLITRGRHPADARARKVGLTVKGRRMYERLWAAVGPVRDQLLAALGPGDAETLRALLARVTMAMAPAPASTVVNT